MCADTIPLLAFFLMVFHFVLLVPMITLVTITEHQQYECNEKVKVRTALIGIVVLYTVSVAVEALLILCGMLGGPFEEEKRWMVGPLMYMLLFLLLVNVGFTAYGTYLANNDDIEQACWSRSPCSSIQQFVPSSCTLADQGNVALSNDCKVLVKNANEIDPCARKWVNSGLSVRVLCCYLIVGVNRPFLIEGELGVLCSGLRLHTIPPLIRLLICLRRLHANLCP